MHIIHHESHYSVPLLERLHVCSLEWDITLKYHSFFVHKIEQRNQDIFPFPPKWATQKPMSWQTIVLQDGSGHLSPKQPLMAMATRSRLNLIMTIRSKADSVINKTNETFGRFSIN